MKPRTELILRQAARWICLGATALLLAVVLIQTLAILLSIPAFILILKIAAVVAAALAATHFWLSAIGKENKARIEELKSICEDDHC